jgi:5-methylcytosine-specific restriction endonuclease McrA
MIPTPTDYWRALILYGKNQSTYKIALGRLLLRYASTNNDRIDMDIVASDFFDEYFDRCKSGKPQLAWKGRFTDVEQQIHEINVGKKKKEDSLEFIRERPLKNMVFKHFNVLYRNPIKEPFFSLSENSRYLVLHPNLLSLADNNEQPKILHEELSSRWDLLEHAFEITNNTESLDVDEYLKHIVRQTRRSNLTKLIPTLNGYQQNRCFYCGEELYNIEVDHVIPRQALKHDEIWNLVLAHYKCNSDKNDNLPPTHFLDNLIARNEFLIESAHPIKDTLIKQTGNTPAQRKQKIINEYQYAKSKIGRIWGGNDKYDPRKDEFYRGWVRYLGKNVP